MKKFIDQFLPNDYVLSSERMVQINKDKGTLTRYQSKVEVQLGGTHFSMISNDEQCFRGFVWLAPQFVGGTLPSKMEAQAATEVFLEEFAPDLAIRKEVYWIKPHDENLIVNGKKQTVTGMKVKMRNPKNELWFWVVIGNQGKPIVFERDIIWVSFPGKRKTEKWLHDEWLEKHS